MVHGGIGRDRDHTSLAKGFSTLCRGGRCYFHGLRSVCRSVVAGYRAHVSHVDLVCRTQISFKLTQATIDGQ